MISTVFLFSSEADLEGARTRLLLAGFRSDEGTLFPGESAAGALTVHHTSEQADEIRGIVFSADHRAVVPRG